MWKEHRETATQGKQNRTTKWSLSHVTLQEDRAVQVSQGTGWASMSMWCLTPWFQLWVTDHTRLEVMESNPIHTDYLESRAGTGLASSSSLELCKSKIHDVQLHVTPWHKETRRVQMSLRYSEKENALVIKHKFVPQIAREDESFYFSIKWE